MSRLSVAGNQALEGLVKQVLPVRVALQLRESAAQQQQQQSQMLAALASPGSSSRPTAAAAVDRDSHGAGSSSSRQAAGQRTQGEGSNSGSGSSVAAAAVHQPQLHQGADAADGAGDTKGLWLQQPPRWQRQHQLRYRNPLLQQQLQQQQQVQHSPQTGPQGIGPWAGQVQQQQQQQAVPDSGNASGPLLMFRQPQLEHAFRVSTCRQWQQWLDILFLMLSLLSAVGGRLASFAGRTGSPAVAGSLLLVLAVVLWALLQQLLAMPVPRYLQLRVPGIAAVRLLRVLLFCLEAQQLPAQVFERPPIAVAPTAGGGSAGVDSWGLLLQQLQRWSPAEFAGCGIALMQGLLGQLPLAWHASVQAVAVAALLGSLSLLTVDRQGAAAVAPVYVMAGQLLVGWAVPVMVVALSEWHMRKAFLRRIR
jgi:hypothetical protein